VTLTAILLCIACQILIVIGQLLLKRGISGKPPRAGYFSLGMGCLTLWFFLWLGLMGKWDLSKLYPFEGLNPAMMAIGAWLVLKEKLPTSAWVGLALVGAGVAIVAGS
jgi:drug/metabolite transporter (DMT)-like permease